jgi:hypothetical protein
MARLETVTEALEKWAKVQPHKLAWQFHNDKLEVEETYTYKVSPCNDVAVNKLFFLIKPLFPDDIS